jgi:iron complex outermembrane receptor protein
VLLEYSLSAVPGLVTSLDYQFSGTRPGNDTNSFRVAGYNLFDVGVRYNSKLFGSTSVWRLAVNNLTDRNYYSTISPSNLSGTNTGNLIAHLGSPRMVLASLSIYF